IPPLAEAAMDGASRRVGPSALGFGGSRYRVDIMGLFKKKMKQEHKVMLQHERAAGALLPEYHRATPECPEPERWSMIDSMTAEVEVLEFIATLVTTIKPRLVVETGSFLGVSTEWIARGLQRNGFGKIISCEFDPVVYARAKERLA